jgi:hypothetical protein
MFTAGIFRVLPRKPPLSNHSFQGLKKSSNTEGIPSLMRDNDLVDILPPFLNCNKIKQNESEKIHCFISTLNYIPERPLYKDLDQAWN